MIPSLRIAVADDEADTREFYRRILTAMGHRVVAVAEDGRQLIDDCRKVHPDLVISDVRMPRLDGIDAAVELSRDEPLPIILVSAYHDPDLVRRAAGDAVTAYLEKPVGRKDLEPAIARAVERFEELQKRRNETATPGQAAAGHDGSALS